MACHQMFTRMDKIRIWTASALWKICFIPLSPLWLFAGVTPVCPCLSGTGGIRTGVSTLGSSHQGLNREGGSPSLILLTMSLLVQPGIPIGLWYKSTLLAHSKRKRTPSPFLCCYFPTSWLPVCTDIQSHSFPGAEFGISRKINFK